MKIKILNKYWKIIRSPNRRLAKDEQGYCAPQEKEIYVSSRVKGLNELRIYLHEALHGCAYDVFDEGFVDTVSWDLGRLLWRLGYRKVEKQDD